MVVRQRTVGFEVVKLLKFFTLYAFCYLFCKFVLFMKLTKEFHHSIKLMPKINRTNICNFNKLSLKLRTVP